MANEITAVCSLTASKGGANIASGSQSKTYNMTGTHMIAATGVAVADDSNGAATQAKLLDMGDVTHPGGTICIKNLDTANPIELGMCDSLPNNETFEKYLIGIIPAGLIRLITPTTQLDSPNRSNVYIRSQTANVNYQVWAVDE